MADHGQRTVVAVTSGFDTYHNAVLTGARTVLAEHGVGLIAHSDLEVPAMPATLDSLVRDHAACGVILLSARSHEHHRVVNMPLASIGLPVVHIGQDIAGQACVRADNAQGMSELMSLVLDACGARHPALIRGFERQPDHIQREEIFRAEVLRRGLEVDEDRFIGDDSNLDNLRHEVGLLLERLPDTDAVVTMHDWCALAAMEGCIQAGRRVPEDIVVTGFDNYPMPAIVWPGVSTVDQNLAEQGATAARMILDALAGEDVHDHVFTKCEVVPRGSTAVGEARFAGVPPRVEHVARLASAHMKAQDELDALDQALMRCRSVDAVCDLLPDSLTALGITRAFLVTYDADQAARLVLDFRDGHRQPVPGGTFAPTDLLPEYLRGQLYQGFLAALPMEGTERPLGHLFVDLSLGQVPFVADLESIVNRTLETIANLRALSEHSAHLERLVAERSNELMNEISVRQAAEQELRRANAVLRRMEATDGLTKVANRRAMERHFAEYWQRLVDERAELTVLLVDVDHFKAYNDRYGHLVGDEALQTVAECLSGAARYPDDLVCRFGGEEFAVVLPYSGQEQGLTVANRFARALAAAAIPHEASPTAPVVTASVGIATIVPTAGDQPEVVVAIADESLYRAKREGRNRIRAACTVEAAGVTGRGR